MARTGRDPSELYAALTRELGAPVYERIDAPATTEEKAVLLDLSLGDVSASELAGHPIEALLTTAPGNGAPIGGLKVVTSQGWFAARPSGTEDVYRLYAESFVGSDHLRRIQEEGQAIISRALAGVAEGKHPFGWQSCAPQRGAKEEMKNPILTARWRLSTGAWLASE
jgi:phosphoglucomutase